jgi:PKD repeat protein
MFIKTQFLMFVVNKMKRIAIVIVALLAIAAVVPLIVINAQAVLSAGPDQQVNTGETVFFNGTTTENVTSIVQVTWDFGDNTTIVNGTSPDLLNATHMYTDAGIYNATLTVKFDSTLNKTETDSAIITVFENLPPVANAGPNQTVEQTSPQGANVALNGTGSIDPNNDTLTYFWNWTGGSASGVSPTVMLPPGMTDITLTVSDGEFNSTDTVSVTVADTTPPYVNAGEDKIVEADSPDGAEVMLQGEATDDVDMDLDYVWSEEETAIGTEANLTITLSLGTHTLTLNATDDSGNTGTDTVTIEVVDTTPPEVNAGEDKTVEAGYETTIHGSATDLVDIDLDYVWKEGQTVLGTEADLTYTFTLGTHVLTLSATDDSGNTGTDSVTIEAVDTTPPEINASVAPDMMWPPNHKYVDVETVVTVHDAVDPSPTLILVSVTSNEPDNGKGDGDTTNDIVILGDSVFRLRAERSGTGQGRTYTITYRATDASGNSAETSVTVMVPHNK